MFFTLSITSFSNSHLSIQDESSQIQTIQFHQETTFSDSYVEVDLDENPQINYVFMHISTIQNTQVRIKGILLMHFKGLVASSNAIFINLGIALRSKATSQTALFQSNSNIQLVNSVFDVALEGDYQFSLFQKIYKISSFITRLTIKTTGIAIVVCEKTINVALVDSFLLIECSSSNNSA